MNLRDGSSAESQIQTPYAVRCDLGCNKSNIIFLTEKCYITQMDRPDAQWSCPRCGSPATWDDDNYENYMKKNYVVKDETRG